MPGAYLYGWDSANQKWVKCYVDSNGKLIIGSGTVTVEQATPVNLKAQIFPGDSANPIPVGKIPDGAVQVVNSDHVSDGAVVLHTVSAGKTFYLTHCSIDATGDADGFAYIAVRNTDDVDQYMILHAAGHTGFGVTSSPVFIPPIEIPSGWDVTLYSPSTYTSYGFVHGYEL